MNNNKNNNEIYCKLILNPGKGKGDIKKFDVKEDTLYDLPSINELHYIPPENMKFFYWINNKTKEKFDSNETILISSKINEFTAIYKEKLTYNPNNNKVKLIFIGGASRSGKSTISKYLKLELNLPPEAIIQTDKYFDYKKIKHNHYENIKKVCENEEFKTYIKKEGTKEDQKKVNDYINYENKYEFYQIEILYNYINKFYPLLADANWETDEVINWEKIGEKIEDTLIKLNNNNIKYLIVEGFRLFQERYPFNNHNFKVDKSIFITVDKNEAKIRREKTKPMAPGHFDGLLWPEYVNAHKHLINLLKEGNKDYPLYGNFLIFDGKDLNINKLNKVINFIEDKQNISEEEWNSYINLLEYSIKE